MDEVIPRCAYTGAILTIERLEGTPLWVVKGAFNPAEWVPGTEFDRLKRELFRRPSGKKARKLVCPYKGTPVSLEEDLGMVRASGAFSPGLCFWESRQEALWEVCMRDGKEPDFPRKIRIVVGEPTYPESDPMQGYGSTTGDISAKVEELV